MKAITLQAVGRAACNMVSVFHFPPGLDDQAIQRFVSELGVTMAVSF